MKTIRINAKSIPTLEELKPKIDAGFRNIEIQLIHKKVAKSEYEEIKEAIVNQYIDVSVVHTPLMKNPNFEIALNHLLLFGIDEILDDICKFAEYIARIENHRIKVVIHNDCSEEEWITSLAGTPGETPSIGANGHWFIGAVDTGVAASGVTSYNDLTDKPTLNGDVI